MIHDESAKVQEFVHQVEAGTLKRYILIATFCAAVAALATLYLFFTFNGLNTETAMDQAQIGRQIAAGQGFTTLYVRPLAMWQFLGHEERLPPLPFPDTYNFPLNPLLNAVALRPVKRWWPMEPTDFVYFGDRVIAFTGVMLFFASLVVIFFLVRGLFDRKVAWMTLGLTVLSDLLWRFSVSGLPQMLLLFLFSLALYLMHRAIVAREERRLAPMLVTLGGIGFLFGLMTLAQPLTSWIFLGFLIFTFIWFRPHSVSGLLVFFIYLALVTPWLVRNYLVTGNPLGLGIFSILDGTTGTEYSFMSTLQPDLTAFGAVRAKLRSGLVGQFENLFSFFGYSVVATAFFFSLLHVFKRGATNMMRWALALMWVFAAFGMAVFAPHDAISVNQLHILFLPVFSAFGVAFLVVLWNRMNLRLPFARTVFLTIVFLISSLPMAIHLLTLTTPRSNWPPYIPPFIHAVSNWMEPNEVIATDMPWATAWYGGRMSLLLPSTIRQFITIHDYKYLGGPVNGIYLTPVSGNRPFLSQIAKGDYREWSTFIMRTADLTRFPLQYFTPLPLDNECVFYSNIDRWTPRD